MGVVDGILEKRPTSTRQQFNYKLLKTATLIAMWITSVSSSFNLLFNRNVWPGILNAMY